MSNKKIKKTDKAKIDTLLGPQSKLLNVNILFFELLKISHMQLNDSHVDFPKYTTLVDIAYANFTY